MNKFDMHYEMMKKASEKRELVMNGKAKAEDENKMIDLEGAIAVFNKHQYLSSHCNADKYVNQCINRLEKLKESIDREANELCRNIDEIGEFVINWSSRRQEEIDCDIYDFIVIRKFINGEFK